MKKALIFTLLFVSQLIVGQVINNRYNIDESARLIISSNDLKNNSEIEKKLNSGETIILRVKYQQLKLIIKSKQEKTYLKTINFDLSSLKDDNIPILELYEYDFDNDGDKEIIVVHSLNETTFADLEVYKHKETLVKKIGDFEMGIAAVLQKNIISLYSGIRDSHLNYIFFEDQFWKMNWHNPNE